MVFHGFDSFDHIIQHCGFGPLFEFVLFDEYFVFLDVFSISVFGFADAHYIVTVYFYKYLVSWLIDV